MLDRELSGQCPWDDGRTCYWQLDNNYQGPGCRNTACAIDATRRFDGKAGLLQVLEQGAAQVALLTAEADYLDLWGSFFNVVRRDGESDSDMLDRIVTEWAPLKVTRPALLALVQRYFPDQESSCNIIEYEKPHNADLGFYMLTDAYMTATPASRDLAGFWKALPSANGGNASILSHGNTYNGDFDAFNASLGLYPYQFRVVVPSEDRFNAFFVVSTASVTAGSTAAASYFRSVPLADGSHDTIQTVPGFRVAKASKELKALVRRMKAGGTQPLYTAAGS